MIHIASDHAGYDMKEKITAYLKDKGIDFKDQGTCSSDSCDYPEYGSKLAQAVQEDSEGRGILVCGSGVGMSIVANKFKGVYCALCFNEEFAKLSRQHNNSNVIAIPGRMLEEDQIMKMIDVWMSTGFEGDTEQGVRHKQRFQLIVDIEEENMK